MPENHNNKILRVSYTHHYHKMLMEELKNLDSEYLEHLECSIQDTSRI